MSAYLPTSVTPLVVASSLVLADIGLGYWLVRRPGGHPRVLAWTKLALGIAVTHWAFASEPAGLRMLALVLVGLVGLKLVVVAQRHVDDKPPLSVVRWLGFGLAWLGMRPEPFAVPRRPALREARVLVAGGLRRVAQGVLVLGLARVFAGSVDERATMAMTLMGASLVLHFGLCAAMAGAWRWWGVAVQPLFREPTRATSLTEFWGRRWNLAFSHMTQQAIYRPLRARFGRGLALAAAFGFSGLLHEMEISLPVDAGYGGPLAYFVLHGGLVLLERRARAQGIVVSGRWGRVWTLACVCLPLPWLFHASFVRAVLFPLIGVC